MFAKTPTIHSLALLGLTSAIACSSDPSDNSTASSSSGSSGVATGSGGPTSGGATSTTTQSSTGVNGTATESSAVTTGAGGASSGSGTTGLSTAGSVGGASAGGASAGGTQGSGGASSTTGAGGVGGGGTPPTGITGLTIEANPNSVLSCIVTWTTDQPSNSVVQFGVGGYQWEIADSAITTDHRVVVIGMRREQAYSIKAISVNDGGSAEAEGDFTTGTLPATIPVGTVEINDSAASQPGWTLMNVQKGDGSTGARSPAPPMAVMYDDEGEPVWYYIDGTVNDRGGAVSTQLTDVGVLIGPSWNDSLTTGTFPREVDFEGNVVWECPSSLCGGSASFSHHASKLPNGHYMLNEDNGSGTTSPRIHELDGDQEVWTVDWTDLLPAPQGASGDWCHGNSISADLDNDIVWVNCRWVGFMKINYTAKTMAWLIPASYGSNGLGDFTFSPANSQISDTHDPEFHADDNTVLFFDNGGYGTGAQGGSTAQYHSRAVEYKIDETAMTMTLNWEFPGSFSVPNSWYTDNFYVPFWGDADRLPNGNVLVTAGIRSPSVESRVFEVTKADGQVVWEFRFPPDYGVYRADRITPPLVHALP